MIKKIILLFVMSLVTSLSSYTLFLKDNTKIQSTSLDIDDNHILFDKGKVKRNDVVKISMLNSSDRTFNNESLRTHHMVKPIPYTEMNEISDRLTKKYPHSKGLTIYYYERIASRSDGSEEQIIHYVRQVLSQEKKSWANQSFYFSEDDNNISILFARSINQDGSISEYSPDDILITKQSSGSKFFNKGKKMVLSIPNVDIGSFIEIAYVNHYFNPEDPELFDVRYSFQSDIPSNYDRLDIEIPKGRELYYLTQHMDELYQTNYATNVESTILPEDNLSNPTMAKISETDSSIMYSWEMSDIPPIIDEPFMPARRDFIPRVLASFYPDYSYYNKRYSKIYLEHMEPTPVLDSLAFAIIGDAADDTTKIARLYHWVQKNIRYVSIKGTLASGKGGHYAQITYDNKYGDCTDKSVLFATLLRIVGIEAYSISLLTNRKGFPDRSLFPSNETNHCINEVWWDGEPHVLDATGTYYRFPDYSIGDTDIWYCNYIRGEHVYNPPMEASKNMRALKRSMIIDSTGKGFVQDSLYFVGNFESSWRGWLDRKNESERKTSIEYIMNNAKSGSVLDTFAFHNLDALERPFSLEIDYYNDHYLENVNNFLFMDIPFVQVDFPEIALNERKYDIKLPITKSLVNTVEIILDSRYSIFSIPDPIHVSNEYFAFDASVTTDSISNTIRISNSFSISKMRIPVEDYKMYKIDAESILQYMKNKIILKATD